jgi:hypothetical protein
MTGWKPVEPIPFAAAHKSPRVLGIAPDTLPPAVHAGIYGETAPCHAPTELI